MTPTVELPPLMASTVQVTAVLLVFCTVAVNCVVVFTFMVAEDWLSCTDTGAEEPDEPDDPHPANVRARATARLGA